MERSPKKIFKIKEGIFGKKTGRLRAFPISLISLRCDTGLGDTALKRPFQLFLHNIEIKRQVRYMYPTLPLFTRAKC